MLQPRLGLKPKCGESDSKSVGKMGVFNRGGRRFAAAVCIAVFMNATLVLCQDTNIKDKNLIEASRIKRDTIPDNRDLTVLLVNDQKRPGDYNSKGGRYHSVKPLIGLLTSTARTFIQDGVTTEFATQILGTTLNNGRIYAQILTKSSLVLYNKPDDGVLVKPTRVHSAFDGEWNVKEDLGFIDPGKFVLKNTDYIEPNNKMEIVYASKPADDILGSHSSPTSPDIPNENQIFEEPTARRVQPVKEIPRYLQNEAFNYLDGPNIETEKKYDYVIKPAILANVNTLHRQSKAFEPIPEPVKIDSRINDDAVNDSNIVKVKPNHDLPTFTIKNQFSPIFYYIDNVESRSSVQQSVQQTKLPKKLFGQKSEPRLKKTFTYAGFADFTTVVGDTVIIFTPNTDIHKANPGQVDVFPSAKPIDKLATKITHLAADIPVATSTYKAYEVNRVTKLTASSNKKVLSENISYDDEGTIKKNIHNVNNKMSDAINVQYNNGFNLNLDVIQPSEAVDMSTESTRITNDLDIIPVESLNSKATEPLKTISPTATLIDRDEESVVTESDLVDYTNMDNDVNDDLVPVTEKEEDVTNTESESELTTENNGKNENDKNIEDIKPLDVFSDIKESCTKGFETLSTMTTAYRTLTYLTTYFIPLKSTETTTSIKSNVVVESNVGYLTNVVCKTKSKISPTQTIVNNNPPTVQISLESPEKAVEYQDKIVDQQSDEDISNTTPLNNESHSTISEEQTLDDKLNSNVEISSEKNQKEPYENISEESFVTTENNVKVSVSEEQSEEVTTESSNQPEKSDNIEKVNSNENEIDLIYKTLYTTYTYFTTFFGEKTSSVASHKSIVTNIITSTINLSNMDPSLLNAFDEDVIAPSNVGIGRPTAINSIIDLVKNKDVIESVEIDEKYNSQTPTPSLGDDAVARIKPDAVKTYFTTYTFFTTIYVGNDANVCSRSEVYTNYVGPDELIPTKSNPLAVTNTKHEFDFRNCKQVKKVEELPTVENRILSEKLSMDKEKNVSEEITETSPQPTPVEVDMLFSVESNPLVENLFVTDVKSSYSKGDRRYLENNNILDDQISSESNVDEILPSPTLLLQTSYTTFTYFTTMYIGKDSSKIKSRLETITNVVTETITPKKDPEIEENNLPITYYTTFTYWTTLYKDKSTTITSREEIVSNVVTPSVQSVPIVNPIDTTPIDVDTVLPPKDIEVVLKPSLVDDLYKDDGKATFYTTYTYFTTFYVGNTSQIRSSLETVTNIVDNTKISIDDNQLGRKVQTGSGDKNLIQDDDNKPPLPNIVKEVIKPTRLPDISAVSPTALVGTYIDNLYADVKSGADVNNIKPDSEKKILFSQVAVISGDSTIVTNDNKIIKNDSLISSTLSSTTTDTTIITPAPDVIESSIAEPESTTVSKPDENEEDVTNPRKKSRLTFTTKKPSITPVIRPFASRSRPTFNPKRVQLLSSATIITRFDFTPTITATPILKSVRPSGFGSNRKQPSVGSNSPRRFSGRSSVSNLAVNVPSPTRLSGYGKGNIQPSKVTGARSGPVRGNNINYASRSSSSRIRPTASPRQRGGRISPSVLQSPVEDSLPNESETSATQQEENVTESVESTEAPVKTTPNPLFRFRRPLISRQPGTAITPRSTTQSIPKRGGAVTRGRVTTTTRRSTTKTTNPLLSLRRQRPNNSLFPRRNLFRQPEPEPEEELKENEEEVESGHSQETEGEDFEEDNEYDSSDRKEQQVTTTQNTPTTKKNIVQIKPFTFKRRTKRQIDYGNRKYSNFRRPSTKSVSVTRRSEPEPETEAPTTHRQRTSNRFSSRVSGNSRSTTSAPAPRSSVRQPFIIRGESRSTTPSVPSFKNRKSRPSTRTTTISSRPKAPRLISYNSQTERSRTSSRTTNRSRNRGGSRPTTRQRNYNDNNSGEKQNYYNSLNDGKITITHHIPTEVTIPVVSGKITEYKNVITAKPKIEILLLNQVSTSLGPLGQQQLVLVSDSTELTDNGATKVIKFILHETPTTTIIFTPTTIRGRKTSYSHIVPSTIYNVEYVTSTLTPELNANVPLANLLLSQLLLGNPPQPALNPLLALQGQGLFPQQPVVQTPVTEYKVRTTTYVTTVTDARKTVLPITFKGKEILTTIIDPTISVITATEFITETIVTTPTVVTPQNGQLNSLLLLLQQQQQQQTLPLQTPNHVLGLGQHELNLQNNNFLNNDIYNNSPKPNILDITSNEESTDYHQDNGEDLRDSPPPSPPPSRPKNRPRPPKPSPPKVTSVVTLYVSGRTPGEFSTVLSTVVADDTQTVRKREAIYYDDVKLLPSVLPKIEELFGSQLDNLLDNSVLSITDNLENQSLENRIETQSLESIVGEISKHISYDASPTFVIKLSNPSTTTSSTQQSIDDIS